jgi:hypothetical protein
MKGTPAAMADPTSALLQEAPLRELITANVVTGVTAKGGQGGFTLEIRFGDRRALLASARGSARIFASLATVGVFLQRLGYPQFEVDVREYAPGRIQAAQPLRSASVKRGRSPETSSRTQQAARVHPEKPSA